jgi:hypothetical protein
LKTIFKENVVWLVSSLSKYPLHSSYLLLVGSWAMVHDAWQFQTYKSLKWKNDIVVYICNTSHRKHIKSTQLKSMLTQIYPLFKLFDDYFTKILKM